MLHRAASLWPSSACLGEIQTDLVVIARTTVFVMPNSSASWLDAGAIMVDDTGEINVKAEMMAVARHFLNIDQLFYLRSDTLPMAV
jgi:hypothetical protein